jgi:hypothetical protein
MSVDTWTRSTAACPAQDRLASYPSGTTQIVASVKHTGFATSEDVVSQWRLDGDIVNRGGLRLPRGAENGGCYFSQLYYDRGLPEGTYQLEVFGGPTLRPMTTAQTTIGSVAATDVATLAGFVVDADSGRPIPGAVVYLLAPGTDLQTWFNSPQQSQIVSFATTGADGAFLVNGLTAGTSYPGMAMAEGYVAAGGTVGPMKAGPNLMLDAIALTHVAP